MTTSYRKALQDAKVELQRLVAERADVEARIDKVQRTIAALANMLGNPDEALAELEQMYEIVGPTGITDIVRNIFRSDLKMVWSAKTIRDYMVSTNVDLSRYSNALAAIHTVIKRLERAGEIEPVGDGGYRWKGRLPERFRSRFHPDRNRFKGRYGELDKSKLPSDVAGLIYGPKKDKDK